MGQGSNIGTPKLSPLEAEQDTTVLKRQRAQRAHLPRGLLDCTGVTQASQEEYTPKEAKEAVILSALP